MKNMGDTFSDSLQPSQRNITASFSTMTKRSKSASPCGETCSSLTSPSSQTYMYSSLTHKAPTPANQHKRKRKRQDNDDLPGVQEKRACIGTKGLAQPQQNNVSTNTSARTATALDMSMVTVQTNPNRVRNEGSDRPPRYLRPFYWEGDKDGVSHLASISETLPPLPQVPDKEQENHVVTTTIHDNEHLFDIVTPINIDRFQSLLSNHPNQPYVRSVLKGLREGFWPWLTPNTKSIL